jgi:hypothetical protein
MSAGCLDAAAPRQAASSHLQWSKPGHENGVSVRLEWPRRARRPATGPRQQAAGGNDDPHDHAGSAVRAGGDDPSAARGGVLPRPVRRPHPPAVRRGAASLVRLVRDQPPRPADRHPARSPRAVHPAPARGGAAGLLGEHDDARRPRVLPVRAHRRAHHRRPCRLRPAAQGPCRRDSDPGAGPARAGPVPPGRPDDHRPPRRLGLPARHQRAPRVGGRRGADRGLRRDAPWPSGAAPGRQGQQARHDADHRPGPPGAGGLPRGPRVRAAGASPAVGEADRPPRRLPDGPAHRQDRRDPAAHQSALAAACVDHQRAGPRRPAPRRADPLSARRPPHHRALRPRPRQPRPPRVSTSSPPTSPASDHDALGPRDARQHRALWATPLGGQLVAWVRVDGRAAAQGRRARRVEADSAQGRRAADANTPSGSYVRRIPSRRAALDPSTESRRSSASESVPAKFMYTPPLE